MSEVLRMPLPLVRVPDPDPIVRLSGFSRHFGETRVLDDLDLAIAPGEFVALLGRSGSGKTTLLRTLAGLDGAEGQNVTVPASRATVFQDARLLPWKRIWQNVAMGVRGGAARHQAEQALREVGLDHRLDAWPLTLSGGEAQRASLARALIRKPELLLLDEPFAALDKPLRRRLRAELRDLQAALALPMLLVTHDDDDLAMLADEVVQLRDGRVVASAAAG